MSGYYKPFGPQIGRGQRFGDNPSWGPNPPGGHNGDDYLSQVGEPVYAAGDGVVVFAGRFDSTYADNWGWNLNFGGQMVVLNLDGPDGPYVEYGHNSELRVNTGDRVRGGQVIALSGEDDGGTHVITGPHLHVGCLPPNFNLNTNTYGRVNPDIYLTDYPDETSAISVQSATITPVVEEEDMPLSDDDLRKVYQAVWFGAPGAQLIPNEAGSNSEWPYTTLGSMTARISRDIVIPQIANLKAGETASPSQVADAVVAELGKDFAKSVVDELGKRIQA